MRITTTVFLLSLAILFLGTSLADASQQAQLRKFMESRVTKRLGKTYTTNQLAEGTDLWADPASSFGHLPERCNIAASGSKESDKIAALPGQPTSVNFDQYAGNVKVDEEHDRELFYYFAESPYDAASKPLLLWLNGGPGCSSFGYGAMEELGPFRVNPDGKTLSMNKHAWNNPANVIFLDSPAGVGFSSSRNTSDYTTGDQRTAEDTYVFLVKWLERFPEYKGRDFYVAGESYGGHYVPELATIITYMNSVPSQQTPINIRGIIVGNPYLDDNLNYEGELEYLWSHGVLSDEVWAKIQVDISVAATVEIGDIDVFNIYAPVCLQSSNGTYYSSSYFPGYDACIDNYVETYLNNLKVQKALHSRINTNWSLCNNMGWKDAPVRMVPIMKRLIDHGLRVWIYSGDFDSMCSLTSTRYSVKDLNLTVTEKWRPWYTPDIEVGGYVQQYQGSFTLVSVRGAGHAVPTFQPERSLVLLNAFLKNMLPPSA